MQPQTNRHRLVQKYHSLHARGLTVTEALHKYDAALANGAEHASAVDAAYEPPNEDMTGIDEHNQHNDPVNTEHSTMLHANGPSANQSQPAYPAAGPESGSSGTGLSGIPSALLSGPMGPASQDAGMKSLLMSWYYAGYYTGLHEGQQKAQGLSGPG